MEAEYIYCRSQVVDLTRKVDVCSVCKKELEEVGLMVVACNCIYCPGCASGLVNVDDIQEFAHHGAHPPPCKNLPLRENAQMTPKPKVHCELHLGNPAAELRLLYPSRCGICFEKQGRGTLRCGHIFCRDCINKWVDHQPREQGRSDFTCPTCRTVQNRCNRGCCHLRASFRPYEPDRKPAESTETIRKRVTKVMKAPAQNVNQHRVQKIRSKPKTSRTVRETSPLLWNQTLSTMSERWEDVQLHWMQLCVELESSQMDAGASSAFRNFKILMEAESRSQQEGNHMSFGFSAVVKGAWQQFELAYGGFGRAQKSHRRLTVMLGWFEIAQKFHRVGEQER